MYGKGEFEPKRELRGAAVAAAAAAAPGKKGGKAGGGGGGGGVVDLLADMPRENISKKLTSKVLEEFKHKDPKIRMKAPEKIEAILREAKMRIEPDGIGELMDVLKQGMKESNMAGLRANMNLLGLMAEAVGQPISKYQKKCLVPLIDQVKNKNSMVTKGSIAATEKWADAIGAHLVINHIGQMVIEPNPEGRMEGLSFILRNSSSIPEADMSALVGPMLKCLNDRKPEIRQKSEEIIGILMTKIGASPFMTGIKSENQATQ